MSCATTISPIEVLSADDLGRRRDWSDGETVRIVQESQQGVQEGSGTARRDGVSGFVPVTIMAASCEVASPPPDDAKTIEIGLPNGRRLTIPVSLDPTILARLLPVVDAP